MLYARHKSVIVHSPDAYSARNSFRFSTTPLALHGMTTCTRLRERTKPVKHPPGLFCKVCPRFVPSVMARLKPCPSSRVSPAVTGIPACLTLGVDYVHLPTCLL